MAAPRRGGATRPAGPSRRAPSTSRSPSGARPAFMREAPSSCIPRARRRASAGPNRPRPSSRKNGRAAPRPMRRRAADRMSRVARRAIPVVVTFVQERRGSAARSVVAPAATSPPATAVVAMVDCVASPAARPAETARGRLAVPRATRARRRGPERRRVAPERAPTPVRNSPRPPRKAATAASWGIDPGPSGRERRWQRHFRDGRAAGPPPASPAPATSSRKPV